MTTPAVVVDTRGIAPTPERLLRIVEFYVSAGVKSLFIDFSGRFPWGFDSRLCGPDAFPDELIAAIDRRCTQSGVSPYLIQGSLFPQRSASVPAYRRILRDAARTMARDPNASASGPTRRFLGDLVEDAVGLIPSLAGICWVPARRRELVIPNDYVQTIAEEGIEAGTLTHSITGPAGMVEHFYNTRGEIWPVVASNDLGNRSSVGGSVETRAPVVAAGMAPAVPAKVFSDALGDASLCISAGVELDGYLAQVWESVGRLHGMLAEALEDPGLRGYELAEAVQDLKMLAGRAGEIEKGVAAAYAGRATTDSVRRLLRPHFAAVREQHAALAQRAAHLRSTSHFAG